MFDRNKEKARKISQLTIVFCIVVFFTWFVAGQFTEAAHKGRDSIKKFELRQLEQSLAIYELTYGKYPISKNFPDWCVVGKRYDNKVCLFELTRDGFMSALPVSPDEHPFMYVSRGRSAFIAIGFDEGEVIPEDQLCTIEGITVWCLKVVAL